MTQQLTIFLDRAVKVPQMDALGSCDPYVAMTLCDAGGQPKTKRWVWPYKDNTRFPIWSSPRPFGQVEGTDKLRIELLDSDTVSADDKIGFKEVPVSELQTTITPEGVQVFKLKKDRMSCWLKLAKPSPRIHLQRLVGETKNVKRIFLVRHGRSKWNTAQADKDVVGLLSQVDHPLDKTGVSQAKGLAERLEKAVDDETTNEKEKEFLNADVVLSSPLTRALQTAMLACKPVVKNDKTIKLAANAREKRNFGGRDSSGTETGEGCKKRAVEALKDYLDADQVKACDEVKLNFDEVQERWWVDSKEAKDDMGLRLQELFMQMWFTPHEKIILVGHSHFFREIFRQFADSKLEDEKGELLAQLRKAVIQNCGVAAIDVDFGKVQFGPDLDAKDHGMRIVTDVELLFDSELAIKVKKGEDGYDSEAEDEEEEGE